MDSGGLFGCAGILLLLAGVLAFGGYNNHQWWLQRQEQIPRFKPVRATVDDKGIARYDSRDSRGSTKTEYKRWIRFTCRLGDAGDKDGARLTLSGSDLGWESSSPACSAEPPCSSPWSASSSRFAADGPFRCRTDRLPVTLRARRAYLQ